MRRSLSSLLAIVVLLVAVAVCAAQQRAEPPKLLIMISIDQFPAEYLERMRPDSREGAFLRLCDDGANYINCHHGQAMTRTGPGHSVFLTGTFPNLSGIVDNDWWDPDAKGSKKNRMYCVDDVDCEIVGAVAKDVGKSPKNLLTCTLGDVLKLSRPKARVFSLGLKDRAAILMAGHSADGVYWLENGQWVTSTHYRKDLPGYLRQLNESHAIDAYGGKTWSLLHSMERYTLYYPDDADFEGSLPGSGHAFPHKLPEANPSDKGEYKEYTTAMTTSPFGSEYTLATARTIIESERLGRGESTDILAINLSSNDYIGHMFGPHSLEVQDMTYRTDLLLGEFFGFIERQLAGAAWVVAVSSDHGVAPVPEYAKTLNLPAGRNEINLADLEKRLDSRLRDAFNGKGSGKFVVELDENNVYINADRDELKGAKLLEARRIVRDMLMQEPTVAIAFTREELISQSATEGIAQQFQRAFHPDRNGDVMWAQTPYQILGKTTATHGSPWSYDSHVPLLMWGDGIRKGRFERRVTPASIAPTFARLLGIDAPPSCAVPALDEALAP